MLYQTVRGLGGLVVDQPADQDDQDQSPRRRPSPSHSLSTGRNGNLGPDGARLHRHHPPIASANVMWMAAIYAQTGKSGTTRSSAALKSIATGPRREGVTV